MNVGYKTLAEWERDIEIFKKNPNDNNLLYKIKERVDNAVLEVKLEIHANMEAELMDSDPLSYFQFVLKDVPRSSGLVLRIKNKKDPWYEV